jgi:hypothetical protein
LSKFELSWLWFLRRNFFKVTYPIFVIISPSKDSALDLYNFEFPFLPKNDLTSLIEIGLLVLEKKIFKKKNSVDYFSANVSS